MRDTKRSYKSQNPTGRGKYLDPKADLTFKLVFGEHPDLTMSLLNSLLPLDDDGQITEVDFITNEMVPDNPGKKYSVLTCAAATSGVVSSSSRCSSTGIPISSSESFSMRRRPW